MSHVKTVLSFKMPCIVMVLYCFPMHSLPAQKLLLSANAILFSLFDYSGYLWIRLMIPKENLLPHRAFPWKSFLLLVSTFIHVLTC